MLQFNNLFSENHAINETWKYGKAIQATDHNIKQHVCFSGWTAKATETHSEYTILTACPQYQWLQEHAPKLRYMYTVCLVYSLQPVKQRPEQFFASGHECFLPRTSQFINYKHPSPIYTLATVFLTHRNQQHMPNVIRSRPVFNPLVLNNAYAMSQEVRFKFLHDTAYAAAQYGHSCTSLLGFSPCHCKPQ
jgi:hypothetical protein